MIELSSKNVGRPITINGKEETIDKILKNKSKFRKKHGEGETVQDLTFEDIEKAEGLIIDIK